MLYSNCEGFRHSGYRLEDILSYPYVSICEACDPRPGHFVPMYGIDSNKLRKSPLNDVTYQISRNSDVLIFPYMLM